MPTLLLLGKFPEIPDLQLVFKCSIYWHLQYHFRMEEVHKKEKQILNGRKSPWYFSDNSGRQFITARRSRAAGIFLSAPFCLGHFYTIRDKGNILWFISALSLLVVKRSKVLAEAKILIPPDNPFRINLTFEQQFKSLKITYALLGRKSGMFFSTRKPLSDTKVSKILS